MRLRYNAPVTLSFAIASAVVLAVDKITGGAVVGNLFTIWPDFRLASLLAWFRLFAHPIGHASLAHLVSNFSFILLIGPVLEEKYGSLAILAMMLVTAAATGLLAVVFVRAGLLGASGIVFMLILLSSFTNIRSGEIPLTFLLIVALYLVREFINALSPDTVSQLAHIAGGTIGGVFGFLFARRELMGPKGPPAPGGAAESPAGTAKPPETPGGTP